MATRSRLGRDPLSGVAKPGDKKPARPASKSQAPKKTVSAPAKTKAAAVQPDAAQPPMQAPIDSRPAGLDNAATAPEATAVPVRPIPESVLAPEGAAAVSAVVPSVETLASEVQPIPQSVPIADVAATPEATVPCAPAEGPHPAEVFLRGVLEGLTPVGGLTIDVDVDPETFTLPVEKLFYFSHVLQLLVSPLECPSDAWRRPGDGLGPVATLSVRLRKIAKGRHSLRIYDNGLFFRHYLSDVSLELEALRPLVLFVIKRHGSICLKQATSVEFEIIG